MQAEKVSDTVDNISWYIITPIVLPLVKLGRTKVVKYTMRCCLYSVRHFYMDE